MRSHGTPCLKTTNQMFILEYFQYEGKVDCMVGLGITESFSVKRQVLVQASEAAEMILRVDNILKAAPRPRKEDRGHC